MRCPHESCAKWHCLTDFLTFEWGISMKTRLNIADTTWLLIVNKTAWLWKCIDSGKKSKLIMYLSVLMPLTPFQDSSWCWDIQAKSCRKTRLLPIEKQSMLTVYHKGSYKLYKNNQYQFLFSAFYSILPKKLLMPLYIFDSRKAERSISVPDTAYFLTVHPLKKQTG